MRLKLETLQPTSSYKVRGAFNAVLRMAREHGGNPPQLVTASAGNHGRALAWAVRAGGMSLTVYVPEHAPRTKVEAIAASGAVLVRCRDYDEAERRAKEHALREGAVFVSPYNHADVIAGAGTIGLEILDEWPDVDLIVVPIGGGGLISGIALAVKEASPRTQVAGVEVEASCPFTRGLEAGRIVEIDVLPTLADGLAGNLDPETMTFDIVRREVARIAVVNEDHLRKPSPASCRMNDWSLKARAPSASPRSFRPGSTCEASAWRSFCPALTSTRARSARLSEEAL